MAIVVRLGEKRILTGALEAMRKMAEDSKKRCNESPGAEAVRGSKKTRH